MKIIPKEGDYIKTAGLTEEQYHKVAKKIISLGFSYGEYPDAEQFREYPKFGIVIGRLYHGDESFNGRELSLSDLLGDKLPYHHEWIPEVGSCCEISAYMLPNSFRECKVLFISDYHCIVESKNREDCYHLQYVNFRPLKSDREKVIQEMKQSVSYESRVSTYERDSSLANSIISQLYDAGYRKVNV